MTYENPKFQKHAESTAGALGNLSLEALDGCRESADREGTICTAMRDSIVPNHKTPDRGRATSAPVHAGHQ